MKTQILCDNTHSPHSLREWGLVLFLAYSFLSRPFFVDPFFPHGLYNLGFLFLFLANLVTLLYSPRIRLPQKNILSNLWLAVLFVSYGAYIFFLAVASIWHADSTTPASLTIFFVRVITAAMLFTLLPMAVYRWTLDRYTDLVFICSVTGIAMVILVFMNILSPIGTIDIPGIERTSRDIYALGLVWGSIYLPGGGTIVRLQSFADEPGTFAFMLLIAILWAFYKQRMMYVGVMIVALLLTWSVGAMMAGAILLVAYLLKWGSYKSLFITMGAIVLFFVLYQANADLIEVTQNYLESKGGDSQNTTSYGERSEYITKLSELILAHPEGVGSGAKEIGQPPVGWLVALADAGVLGYVFYIIASMVLMWIAIRSALLGKGEVAILGIMVLVLAFSALQRARIDYSIWHFWILSAFLRFYIASPKRHFNFGERQVLNTSRCSTSGNSDT